MSSGDRRVLVDIKIKRRFNYVMVRATSKSRARGAARRPGRPEGAAHRETVRANLLGAARELFAKHDFTATAVRDIAAAARVNPAMIHYHFGDKEGLYRAMLQEAIGPVLQEIQDLMGHGGQSQTTIHDVFDALMSALAREPWVARLIVREVLAEEGPFRETFIREFAAKGGGRVPQLLEREVSQGRIRRDLDPTLGALSFLSMALFPFIALPVAEKVFGIRLTGAFTRRLVEHTTQMFYNGAGKRNAPRKKREMKHAET